MNKEELQKAIIWLLFQATHLSQQKLSQQKRDGALLSDDGFPVEIGVDDLDAQKEVLYALFTLRLLKEYFLLTGQGLSEKDFKRGIPSSMIPKVSAYYNDLLVIPETKIQKRMNTLSRAISPLANNLSAIISEDQSSARFITRKLCSISVRGTLDTEIGKTCRLQLGSFSSDLKVLAKEKNIRSEVMSTYLLDLSMLQYVNADPLRKNSAGLLRSVVDQLLVGIREQKKTFDVKLSRRFEVFQEERLKKDSERTTLLNDLAHTALIEFYSNSLAIARDEFFRFQSYIQQGSLSGMKEAKFDTLENKFYELRNDIANTDTKATRLIMEANKGRKKEGDIIDGTAQKKRQLDQYYNELRDALAAGFRANQSALEISKLQLCPKLLEITKWLAAQQLVGQPAHQQALQVSQQLHSLEEHIFSILPAERSYAAQVFSTPGFMRPYIQFSDGGDAQKTEDYTRFFTGMPLENDPKLYWILRGLVLSPNNKESVNCFTSCAIIYAAQMLFDESGEFKPEVLSILQLSDVFYKRYYKDGADREEIKKKVLDAYLHGINFLISREEVMRAVLGEKLYRQFKSRKLDESQALLFISNQIKSFSQDFRVETLANKNVSDIIEELPSLYSTQVQPILTALASQPVPDGDVGGGFLDQYGELTKILDEKEKGQQMSRGNVLASEQIDDCHKKFLPDFFNGVVEAALELQRGHFSDICDGMIDLIGNETFPVFNREVNAPRIQSLLTTLTDHQDIIVDAYKSGSTSEVMHGLAEEVNLPQPTPVQASYDELLKRIGFLKSQGDAGEVLIANAISNSDYGKFDIDARVKLALDTGSSALAKRALQTSFVGRTWPLSFFSRHFGSDRDAVSNDFSPVYLCQLLERFAADESIVKMILGSSFYMDKFMRPDEGWQNSNFSMDETGQHRNWHHMAQLIVLCETNKTVRDAVSSNETLKRRIQNERYKPLLNMAEVKTGAEQQYALNQLGKMTLALREDKKILPDKAPLVADIVSKDGMVFDSRGRLIISIRNKTIEITKARKEKAEGEALIKRDEERGSQLAKEEPEEPEELGELAVTAPAKPIVDGTPPPGSLLWGKPRRPSDAGVPGKNPLGELGAGNGGTGLPPKPPIVVERRNSI